MVSLLDTLGSYDESVSLTVLARETGLHPSTASRILASLAEHGFVERVTLGQYQLGLRLLQLGGRVQVRLDLRREARPILECLRDELDETANLVIREGDEVVYLDRATTNKMMRVELQVGRRAPLHSTAAGKLFLAGGGPEGCRKYAERTGLKAATVHTITDPDQLWRAVEGTLRQGHALDNEEAELGVGCIAVPVRDNVGRVIAGISISAPIERRNPGVWLPKLRRSAAVLSSRLGYEPGEQRSAR